jgi:predicted exporter
LLVDQLRDGPVSRLLLVAIEGGDATARGAASRHLAQALRSDVQFRMVNNGEATQADADRRFVFEHRYLLSPAVNAAHFSSEGLAAAIGESLDALASPAGALLKQLLPADPTGEVLNVIDRLQQREPVHLPAGVWASPSGERALLLAQTAAPGSDTDAQARAIESIRTAFAAATPPPSQLRLSLSGPGVFAVEARAGIEQAAKRLSVFSAAAIFALLFAVYRSLSAVALGLLPVACGALAGIAAVALGFGTVHGITLGFGATLIGEAVDYSIYLFVQSRSAGGGNTATSADTILWAKRWWPTIRLGMFTSIIGFASLLPSAFPGLSQLGLYSIAGLVSAGLITRFVLPRLLPRRFAVRDLAPLGAALQRRLPDARWGWWLATILLLAAVLVLTTRHAPLWNRELSALSPVPLQAQRLDARLRAELGAAEAGALVAVSADSAEAALQAAERAGAVLDDLVDSGEIAGYDSPAQFLPSNATQSSRRSALPPPAELRARLQSAVAGTALPAGRLEPFLGAVEAARTAPLLSRVSLQGTSFAAAHDALTQHSGGRYQALLPLHAPAAGLDLARVRQAFAGPPGAGVYVLDLKQESDALYGAYLREALRLSGLGLGAIGLLLAATLRSARRLARVLAPLLVSVSVVAAALSLGGIQLTILHLIGMLLIVAIGSNYALFFTGMMAPATLASLLLANATTVIAFGTLAASSVPVLSALGQTVAPGALLALLLSACLSGGARSRA